MKAKRLTLEDFLKSLEGETITYGDTRELVVRLARTVDAELDNLYNQIEVLREELGL